MNTSRFGVDDASFRAWKQVLCTFSSRCTERAKWVDKTNANTLRCQKHYRVDLARYRRWDDDTYYRTTRYDPNARRSSYNVEHYTERMEPFNATAEEERIRATLVRQAEAAARTTAINQNAIDLAHAERALSKARSQHEALALTMTSDEVQMWAATYDAALRAAK